MRWTTEYCLCECFLLKYFNLFPWSRYYLNHIVSTPIFRHVYIPVEHLLKSVYAYKNTRTTALIFVKSAQQRVECHDLNEIWAGDLSHAVS